MTREQEVKDILRERREALGLTQEDLAAIANISRGTVRNAEAGKPLVERSKRAIEDTLAIFVLDPWGEMRELIPLEFARPLLQAIARLFSAEPDLDRTKAVGSALRVVSGTLRVGRDISLDVFRALLLPLLSYVPGPELGRIIDYLRDYLSPDDEAEVMSVAADPQLEPLAQHFLARNKRLHAQTSPLQRGAGRLYNASLEMTAPSQDEGQPVGQISQVEFEAPSAGMSAAKADADELVAQVGNQDVSLWRLGGGVKLGLIQVHMSVPVGPELLRLLTKDDLRVIADAVESQVAQLAKSLANARAQQASGHFPTTRATPWKSTRCGHRPNIVGLLDGALDDDQAERTMQEIGSCSDCSEKYEKLREHREMRQKVKEMYESGKGTREIEDALGVDKHQIYAYLHGAGVALREEGDST